VVFDLKVFSPMIADGSRVASTDLDSIRCTGRSRRSGVELRSAPGSRRSEP
jgi:hypothetical protein